jgi:alpha-beta hydrolase superfamily lysophospholipase
MKTRNISFPSDGYRLSGTLHLPESSDPPVVIGSHGLLSSSGSPKQIALAKECADAGIAYFRFDHRGCGNSQGNLEKDTSLETRCSDMLHAVNCLKNYGLSCTRIGLFGSSMGGAVCISISEVFPVNAFVINAAPVKLDRVKSVPEIPEPLTSNLRFDLSHSLNHLHHILIFHGDADEVVPAANAHLIFERAQEPKSLKILPNSDHAMNNTDHQKVFIRESILWFKQHLLEIPSKNRASDINI